MPELPEPTAPGERAEVLVGYLDFVRETVAGRVLSLPEATVRRSVVPSGWAPPELLVHLTHVERRWLEWGFEGAPVADPWADEREERWYVDPALPVADVVAALRERGRTSRAIVARHGLDEVGAPGGRWAGEPPPTLERVLLHLLQEYARHAGHLDVATELAGGSTGE